MKSTLRTTHPLLVGAIALAVATTSGCGWFRANNDYTRSVENRPLEVPPDLDRPETANSLPMPGATPGAAASTGNPVAFEVADNASSVFTRMGAALATIPGVTITGSALGLGSYDVAYQGQNFLVRVEDAGGKSRVSAISASGQVLRAGPAAQLLEQLRAKL